jgi:hypothetical protein
MKDLTGVTIKNAPLKVKALAQLKYEQRLHLPDLQRGFRWSPERVRALHDSLYRRYPVGALLLWKPSWTSELAPFATRAWDIWAPHPETGKGEREPVSVVSPGAMFVLDGQQRLTSLFRVIFRSLAKGKTSLDPDLLVAGTDPRNGVNFDQEDGNALGGWTGCDEFGAHTYQARHAAKRAERR